MLGFIIVVIKARRQDGIAKTGKMILIGHKWQNVCGLLSLSNEKEGRMHAGRRVLGRSL